MKRDSQHFLRRKCAGLERASKRGREHDTRRRGRECSPGGGREGGADSRNHRGVSRIRRVLHREPADRLRNKSAELTKSGESSKGKGTSGEEKLQNSERRTSEGDYCRD